MNFVEFTIASVAGVILVAISIILAVRRTNGAIASRTARGFYSRTWELDAKSIAIYSIAAVAAVVAINAMIIGGGAASKMMDTEIVNGEVTGKEQERVSCSHSYSCNCKSVTTCSGSGSSRSCSTSQSCDTCYEHSNDWDWNLLTNLGKKIEIDRIDRQGKFAPPRWQQSRAGDPVAMKHTFSNYVKASPMSLFNKDNEPLIAKFANQIPAYPDAIYDYHYLNRVINLGVPIPDLNVWNQQVSAMLKQLGPQKQANLVIILTKNADSNFAEAVKAKWLGGKKNDVTVIIGMPDYPKIGWVAVNAWTDKEIFKVKLRDALMDLEEYNTPAMLTAIFENVKSDFVRKSFKDYEYLKEDIQLDTWQYVLLVILNIGLAVGTFFVIMKNGRI